MPRTRLRRATSITRRQCRGGMESRLFHELVVPTLHPIAFANWTEPPRASITDEKFCMTQTNLHYAIIRVKPQLSDLQSTALHIAGMEVHDRLKQARMARGIKTARAAAERLGVPYGTYAGHEAGTRGIRMEEMKAYADAFRVSAAWLAFGEGDPHELPPSFRLEAYGHVGAGAEVYGIDDHAPGEPMEVFDTALPVADNTIGVIVRGDSMYPRYDDGDVIGYFRDGRDPLDLIGKECIVKLADGRYFVKRLRRGSAQGLFNLESVNAPLIEDVVVEWAAEVHTVIRSGQWRTK